MTDACTECGRRSPMLVNGRCVVCIASATPGGDYIVAGPTPEPERDADACDGCDATPAPFADSHGQFCAACVDEGETPGLYRLELCRCSDSHGGERALGRILEALPEPGARSDRTAVDTVRATTGCDRGTAILLLWLLDAKGLLNHGSSVSWAWVDPLGSALLAELREKYGDFEEGDDD